MCFWRRQEFDFKRGFLEPEQDQRRCAAVAGGDGGEGGVGGSNKPHPRGGAFGAGLCRGPRGQVLESVIKTG